MKLLFAVIAAGALFTGTALGAENGAVSKAPGQQMQEKGSVKGSPGASGYAPGQKMQEKGSKPGTTGASGYAPGHSTNGSGANENVGAKDSTKMK